MNKRKVIVVDDDEIFLSELKSALEARGYDAIATKGGFAVIELTRKIRPDVILLDLKMGKVSGFQIARGLKKFPETSKVPIIAMTGHFIGSDRSAWIGMYGMEDLLPKPFSIEDVLNRMETAIKNNV